MWINVHGIVLARPCSSLLGVRFILNEGKGGAGGGSFDSCERWTVSFDESFEFTTSNVIKAEQLIIIIIIMID